MRRPRLGVSDGLLRFLHGSLSLSWRGARLRVVLRRKVSINFAVPTDTASGPPWPRRAAAVRAKRHRIPNFAGGTVD